MESDSVQQQKASEITQGQTTQQQQQPEQQNLSFGSKVGKYTQGIAMKLSKEVKEQSNNVKSYVGQENLGSKIKNDVYVGFKNFFNQIAEGSQQLKQKAQQTKEYFKQDNFSQSLKEDTKKTVSSIVTNVKDTYNGIVEGKGGISETIEKSDQLISEQYRDKSVYRERSASQDNQNYDSNNQVPVLPLVESQVEQQQQNLQQNQYQTQQTGNAVQQQKLQENEQYDYIGAGGNQNDQEKLDDIYDVNKLN